jgi:DNA ligase-1
MALPITVRHADGLHLPELDLWLDPPAPRPCAFVSHAHSDHFARHGWTLCSEVTGALIQKRYGVPRDGELHAAPWHQPFPMQGFELRLLPAGHIFGSAMLHVTRLSDGATLLYTGDFKLRQGLTAERAELLAADTLILETTFGVPQFRFPPTGEVIGAMLRFIRETLDDGGIPVLLGYSLGKAQEILSALHEAGVPVMLHSTIVKMTEVYSALAHTFPDYEVFDPSRAAGHVLLLPPSAARSQAVRRLKVCRTAMLTGWALMPGAKFRYQVDEIFPLSDHADYPELLQCVEQVHPRLVYTVHGYASEFARDLRARGLEAWSLVSDDQMELTLRSTQEAAGSKQGEVASSSSLGSDSAAPCSVPPAPDSFAAWAQTCERVGADSSRLKKQEHLAGFLRNLEGDDLARAVRWFGGQIDDPSRAPLNVGWSIIRRALLELSGIREHEYRAISRSQNDLGRTAFLVMQRAPVPAGNVPVATLADIDETLHALRNARGSNDKTAALKRALSVLPPREGSYLVRLLTGELRIGSKEGLVEEAVALAFSQNADAVREAAMLAGDTGSAAVLAQRGALHEAQPALFAPIKVMLASPEESAEDIWERLAQGSAGVPPVSVLNAAGAPAALPPASIWLEDKYDGIRAQLHRSHDRAEIFTRDLKRITEQFPEIISAARLMKDEVILDGEIIAYAEDRKLTFHDLQKRLGRRDQGDLFISSDITVRFVAFDILWHGGAGLLHEPLETRRAHLERIELPPLIQRITISSAGSAAEIESAFHAARRVGNEGLIAKDRHSPYTPGRRGKTWLKLKKAFSTLDVVVVKAEQGHGKRSHVLSDYTFAVRDEMSGALKIIGKAYSGLTDVEIEELTEHFREHTISQRGHVRTVTPNIVLEIAFDSIQPSQRHDSGLALRFPRIKAIRRDKSPAEIDTLTYARKLAGVHRETAQMPTLESQGNSKLQ